MSRGQIIILFAVLAAANEATGHSTWLQICATMIVGIAWILEDRNNRRKS